MTRNGLSGRNLAADRLSAEPWGTWAGHDGAADDGAANDSAANDSGPARPSRTTNGSSWDPDTEPHGFRSRPHGSATDGDRTADRDHPPGDRNPAASDGPPGGRPEQPAASGARPGPAEPPAPVPGGSWSRNGRYLSPEQCQVADKALTRCRKAEGRSVFGTYGHSGLTAAMRRIEAMLQYGQLLPDTEARALKPPDRFKERLADLIASNPDKPAETLSHEVHDGVRYAFIADPEHYADSTLHVHSRLKGQGFELEVRRNCWNNPEYKGINTRWRDPAHDLAFEVQFHTPSSWEARERLDALYRKVLDPSTPPAEREGLRGLRAELAAAIAAPPKCMMIRDFRRESQ